MKALAVILLVALSAIAAPAGDKDVVVKTDHFTGKTSVVMKSFGIGTFEDKTQLAGGLVSLYLGAATTDDGRLLLVIFSSAQHWQFLNGVDVHALVDEKPIDLGHFRPATSKIETLGAVTTNETLGGYLDRETFAQLANAREVSFEVGAYQSRVNSKHIERLKRFLEALPAAK